MTLLSCYVLAIIYNVILTVLLNHQRGFANGNLLELNYFIGLTWPFYMLLGWSALYFCVCHYRTLQEEKEKLLQAAVLASEAQFKMLSYQLNPHLLFNTINTVTMLIRGNDNKRATKMLAQLCHYLRYVLNGDPMDKVSLKQEVEAIQQYLAIEKIRFEERLTLMLNCSAEANVAQVPRMILQPIIENALKYAVAEQESGGCISLKTAIDQDQVKIMISDDGPGIGNTEAKSGFGLGLSNVEQRLALIYGDAASLCLSEPCQGGVRVTLSFPFEPLAV